MFFDSQGLFWEDQQYVARGGPREPAIQVLKRKLKSLSFGDYATYIVPPLLEPPSGFVALDLETEDPDLSTRGPSWAFPGRGEVVGYAVAWEGFQAYYPVAHEQGNIDPVPVRNWVRDLFQRPDIKIICAHAPYDIGWCKREFDLYPAGGVEDVQLMAAIIDEYRRSYSLESISYSYLKVGKLTSTMQDLENRLKAKHSELMSVMKYLPISVVGPYAEIDARRTFDLRAVLWKEIVAQRQEAVHDLESRLIPMMVEMRRIGMRVDVDKAEEISTNIKNIRIPETQHEIHRLTGVHVNPWEATTCEAALKTIGITCARTATGEPQINSELLERVNKTNPLGGHILSLRKMSKVQSTFIDGHILRHHENGRIHTEFNQLRSERDEGGFGAVTGRFSSTNPNLQNIPIRDPEWGPVIRGLFLSDDIKQVLASLDYKSQEPRLAIHFAYKAFIAGAAEAVETYNKNPDTDYHQFVADLCNIPRSQAKTLNLAISYGAGGAKVAHQLGLPTIWKRIVWHNGRSIWQTIEANEVSANMAQGYQVVEMAGLEATDIIRKWENNAPFLRGLSKMAKQVADERGYVKTLLGRRCRFQSDGSGGYLFTHKAMNSLCQSGAAYQTKSGMILLWEAGIVPRLTVHDELVFSVDSREQAQGFCPYMIEAIKLAVPSLVDVKIGDNWGAILK